MGIHSIAGVGETACANIISDLVPVQGAPLFSHVVFVEDLMSLLANLGSEGPHLPVHKDSGAYDERVVGGENHPELYL